MTLQEQQDWRMMVATVRDKLWMWAHEVGSHDDQFGIPGHSRMTPGQGARYLGVPNVIFVRYRYTQALPVEQYLAELSTAKRLVWSIVGAGAAAEGDETAQALDLAARYPNVCGVQMDDFFGPRRSPDSVAVYTPDEIRAIKQRLVLPDRTLDLWVTFYTYELDLPVDEHLNACDVVECWTWHARDLDKLEKNFARLERKAPAARKALGCYMWDYGAHQPMPSALMDKQCELGLRWLREGRIEAMIFLASCICDLGFEAVEWTRRWIERVGDGGVA
jgi:hypothetical protein